MLKFSQPGLKATCLLVFFGLSITLAACGDEPTPVPTKIEVSEAAAKGLVSVTINGNGLDQVKITLESKTTSLLDITISSNLTLQAQSGATQTMLLRDKREVSLNEQQKKQLVTVPAASLNMERAVPQAQDAFVIAKLALSPDLLKLLNLPDFSKENFRIQQFAIWTITDNPARKDYAKIGSNSGATGPDNGEIQRIRELFGKASISTGSYQGLNG